MLTRRTGGAAFAAVTVASLLVFPTPPALAVGAGDPEHVCAVMPTSAACAQWLEDNPPVGDESEPVCRHLGDHIPCRSALFFQGNLGWWVGDVEVGRGWSYLNRGDPSRVDDPEAGRGHTYGCWGWLWERTGGDTDFDSPGNDPGVEGAWYRLLCLGDQPYSSSINLTTLPGYHREVTAWRETGGGPSGDPEQAARNALAQLELTEPKVITVVRR